MELLHITQVAAVGVSILVLVVLVDWAVAVLGREIVALLPQLTQEAAVAAVVVKLPQHLAQVAQA
jgi:hypothetical protein